MNNYLNFLKSHIRNPANNSLVDLCVKNEDSEYEIIHQICFISYRWTLCNNYSTFVIDFT